MTPDNASTQDTIDDLRATLSDALDTGIGAESSGDDHAQPPAAKSVEHEGAAAADAADERARDERGRFASKPADKPADKPAGQPADKLRQPGQPPTQSIEPKRGAQEPQQQQQPELKAPSSLSPAAREKWAQTPPEVRADVVRRERETYAALQQSAQARQFVQQFEQVVRPYEGFLRARGATNPLEAVDNLLGTVAQLMTQSPEGKARIIASIISDYGVDLQTLDAVLAGTAAPPGAQQRPAATVYDPRVDQLLAERQAMLQAMAQRDEAESAATVAEFAQQGHEFFDDVRLLMADMIEVAARNGQTLSIKDAYDRACRLHPQVSTILQQREAAARAQQQSQAAIRARRAASSVRESALPGGSTVPADDSIRGALEAAFGSVRE